MELHRVSDMVATCVLEGMIVGGATAFFKNPYLTARLLHVRWVDQDVDALCGLVTEQ